MDRLVDGLAARKSGPFRRQPVGPSGSGASGRSRGRDGFLLPASSAPALSWRVPTATSRTPRNARVW